MCDLGKGYVGLGCGMSQLGTLSRKHQEVPEGWSLLSPLQTLRKGLGMPLVSWPNTHPDLVIRALNSQLSQNWFCNYTFRMCLLGKQQPTVAYPIVHVSVTQWMCDSEIFNEPKCDHGVVKI